MAKFRKMTPEEREKYLGVAWFVKKSPQKPTPTEKEKESSPPTEKKDESTKETK